MPVRSGGRCCSDAVGDLDETGSAAAFVAAAVDFCAGQYDPVMKPHRTLRSLALLGAVLVAVIVIVAACDFQVFRSAFGDVTYSIPTVTDEHVRLDGSGRFENEAARVRSAFITGAAGDLDGDGILDGVAVLATNTGGSGTFYTVHAVLGDPEGGFRDVDSVFLGDRIAVPGVELSGATIEVSILDRAEDEGFATEPHIADVVRLVLRDGELFRQRAYQATSTE